MMYTSVKIQLYKEVSISMGFKIIFETDFGSFCLGVYQLTVYNKWQQSTVNTSM